MTIRTVHLFQHASIAAHDAVRGVRGRGDEEADQQSRGECPSIYRYMRTVHLFQHVRLLIHTVVLSIYSNTSIYTSICTVILIRVHRSTRCRAWGMWSRRRRGQTGYASLNLKPITLTPESSTPNPKPYTLNPRHSTLNSKPLTLNPKPSTLNPQPSTLNLQP